MFVRNSMRICLGLLLCVALCSCKGSHDVTGMWHGKMIDPDAQNGGTTDLDAALQQTDRGLSGNITWKNPSGGWRSLGNATFVISSGVVAGDKVSIIASDDLAGGK